MNVLYPEDGGSTFLVNANNPVADYKASHPRRQ
jgi:hypothetical protein